jgi:hypothetical protein
MQDVRFRGQLDINKQLGTLVLENCDPAGRSAAATFMQETMSDRASLSFPR